MARSEMTSYVFMWEGPDGSRRWEAVKKNQTQGFLKKLLDEGVHPATVMVGYAPILFHYVWGEYHRGLTDVNFHNINQELYGTEPVESNHKPVRVQETREQEKPKYGWIAPDGRYFQCDYGGHSHLATKIVGEMESVLDTERHLEEHGWAKIFKPLPTRERYAVGMGTDQRLTDRQLATLKRLGLDSAYGVSCFL